MATPIEKIKRLRLNSDNPFPDAYKTPTDTLKGGSMAEALRAKRARQAARREETPARSRDSAMGSMKNVDVGSGKGTSYFGTSAKKAKPKSKPVEKKEVKETRETIEDESGTLNPAEFESGKMEPMKNVSKPDDLEETHYESVGFKKGGCVKMAKGGSASSRADGCAQRGKTKGRMV